MSDNQTQNDIAQVPKKHRRGGNKLAKGWKIALISLLSQLGLLIVAIVVLLWLVLTPARLTDMVNKLADKYVLCESHFDHVDLTVVKTFPYVGLDIQGVCVINPVLGAPSDTVACIDHLAVGVNLREYLKNSNIEVTKLHLQNTHANCFTNAEGLSNFDIFPSSDEADTSSEPFVMPALVSLKSIAVEHLEATYIDEQSGVEAHLHETDLSVDGRYDGGKLDACMKLNVGGVDWVMDTTFSAALQHFACKVDAKMRDNRFGGDVQLSVAHGGVSLGGIDYVNEALFARQGDLLQVNSHIEGDWSSKSFNIDTLRAALKDYAISLSGSVAMHDDQPMAVDLAFRTNTWHVADLLAILPAQFVEWQQGMSLDADAELSGTAKGQLGDSLLPFINAHLQLCNGRFADRSLLPYAFTAIDADITADLNLNANGITNVYVSQLEASTGRNYIKLTGSVDDLLGSMLTDVQVGGNLHLADLQLLLPDSLAMHVDGQAGLNLRAQTNLEQLQKSQFDRMRLTGTVELSRLGVAFDSIYATIPAATLDIHLPAKLKKGFFNELLSVGINASGLNANLPASNINGSLGTTRINAAISNIFDSTQPFRLVCDFKMKELQGHLDSIEASMSEPAGTFAMLPQSVTSDKVQYSVSLSSSTLRCQLSDSMSVDLAGLSIKGGANYDPAKSNVLQQWSPNLDVDFKRGYIDVEQLAYMVQIPDIKFNYKPERCEISSANVVFGNSDFYLSGAVTGLEKWLSHEAMLRGDLYFTSNYTNVDDLLEALSGMGSDADTLEAQRREDHVDTAAHPFIVPKDVDFTLHTRIKDATAFDNDLQEVAGDVRICDGVAVLNQVGFVCKAARMQLTGMYRTPRVNHIFVGMDFHLLDINIQELVDMIPYVDTMVPLLADLEGNANFHLCAETYVNAFYKPKMSTMRAAAAITGQDLVVLDNADIDRIAKLLQLKNWREDDSKIHVDSLDVAMTLFRKELEVYPFLLSLHKYQLVAEGRHNLDNNYDYHVELVQSPVPVRLAVDVQGTLPKLNFALSPKLRYKNLYRPVRRSDVDDQVLRLKALIRQSLEANVKESTRQYEGFDAED